jgi:subtilisin family serine protease
MKKKLLGVSLMLFQGLLNAGEIQSVPGEIIVKFKPGFAKNFKSKGLLMNREIKLSHERLHVLKADGSNSNFQSLLGTLKNNPDVVYAEPNFIYHATTDDPQFSQLWGLSNTGKNEPKGKAGVVGADINATKAWELTTGSHQIKIAVIDTGVDYNHPDLKGNIWINEKELNGKPGVDDDGNGFVDDIHGYNFAANTSDPMDGHGHGTHVAGTIGALHNNGVGVAGVMGEVTIVPVKFLDDSGSGTLEAALKAIDYATELNVDIMSNSWGGGGRSQALEDAIKRASDKGIIFTAAAGNSSTDNDATPSYPASYDVPNVVSVAALTAQNDLASFSSYGKNSVHIAAPGQNILSTVKGGGYEIMSGTSMATPHVSGVLGLLLAKEGRMPHEVMKERLTMTGVPVAALRGKTQTASRIDAYNLLTDTRPERNEPNPSHWITLKLNEVFESEHPYKENAALKRAITVAGAKYIRIKVAKYDTEAGYDYLRLSDTKGVAVQKISGKGANYTSDYLEGDTVMLDFFADRSVNGWGFQVEEVEVQY